MSKKKNRKIIQFPQSLDAKIRSRARNLKIGKCYITEGWELMREGNIIITRLHTNGNITVGYFLVDLGLLGVKDAFYDFNVSDDRLLDILKENNGEGRFIEIDYELAHNIIYGAVEYAEDYGFIPCKEYAVAKFVLDEDDDNTSYIEIEYGAEGLPTVFCDNKSPRTREIKQMEERVGLGNFKVINTDELGYEDSLYDYENDNYNEANNPFGDIVGDLMSGWDDDIDEMGVPAWDVHKWLVYFQQKREKISARVLQYYADMAFFEHLGEPDIDAFKHVLGGAKYEDSYESELSGEDPEIINVIAESLTTDNPEDVILDAINKNPESISLKLMWLAYVNDNHEKEDARQEFEDCRKQFPDSIILLNIYSGWLIDVGEVDKVPGLFNNAYSLKGFNPDKVFTTNEVMEFCCSYCNYYLAVDDLQGAEPYYEVLDTLIDDDPIMLLIIQKVVFAKMDFLRDLNNRTNSLS
ncbi:MAG: hypothetical protein HQ521_19510 [Bacteroidetes bacterium]|nr:hypothetical protein [Bacteroidota bacterium]